MPQRDKNGENNLQIVCNLGTSHVCKKIKIYSLKTLATENVEIRAIAPYLDNDFPSRPLENTSGPT